jgi:TatA/E family protein of Tat protein translocase
VCGVSGIELVIIVVIAVIFLGPDKLPEFARTVGKLAKDLRNATQEFTQAQDDIKKGFDTKTLLDGDSPKKPRQRPNRMDQNAAAIAAIREEKEKDRARSADSDGEGEDTKESAGAAAAAAIAQAKAEDSKKDPGEFENRAHAEAEEGSAEGELASGSTATDESESGENAESASEESSQSSEDENERPNVPPLDERFSPSGETEWLRKRLQAAVEERQRQSEERESNSELPEIKPAEGTVASGDESDSVELRADMDAPSDDEDEASSPSAAEKSEPDDDESRGRA